ncbi:restriction endonuclease subunit S [Lactococcus cremoris]|nr:restriction endonuclease subunit S [Lactococcus cremoris]
MVGTMAKIDDSVKKKVPELRFPGFTDDWEERKFKDNIVSIQTGTNLLGSAVNEGTPLIKMGNLQRGYFSFKKLEYLDSNSNVGSEDIVNYGDFLFNTRNTLELVGKGATWTGISGKYAFNSNIARFKFDGIDTIFFNYLYNTQQVISQVHARAVGTTSVSAVYPRDLNSLLYYLPSIEEQKKIGSFFKHLDDTIALHQRKLDLLKEQKKGYLQKMFPKNGAKVPELRFAGFADDWEERKLGDTETHFTDGNYGESYPSAKDMSDKANGIPFLRGSDFSNGYLDSSNANYIKPEKHAELTSGHIKQDDIVLAVRGSLGTLGYATKENEGWNINSQLAILRTNKSEISGMFLIQYLLGSKGQKEIFSRNTGTALKQLPIKQLKDIPVPVPTLLEQQKIGSFFKQLDNTIALHQRKLDLLKEQKKGFLQKMFV